MSLTAGTLAAIIGTVGAGYFVDLFGSFRGFLLLTSLLYFLSALFYYLFSTGDRVNFDEPGEYDILLHLSNFALFTISTLHREHCTWSLFSSQIINVNYSLAPVFSQNQFVPIWLRVCHMDTISLFNYNLTTLYGILPLNFNKNNHVNFKI